MASNGRFSRALVAAVACGALLWVAVPSAGLDDLPLLPTTTTTTDGSGSTPTSTTSSSSTSTTIATPLTTTTTAPSDGSTTTTTAPVSDQGDEGYELFPVPPVPPGDGAPPHDELFGPDGPEVPDWALDQMRSIRRSAANSTRRVLEALDPLEAFGFTDREIALVGLGRFPVRGEATFVDDWWFPRWTPDFHLHQGTDVFADFGTPITAPFDGVLTMGESPIGGRYVYLTLEDRTYYYFSHLQDLPLLPDEQRIEDPEEAARYHVRAFDQPVAYRVREGQVIGTVGDTGNAEGGAPHLHFEVHPQGGDPINPKPLLDEWLAEAEAQAPEVVALHSSRGPKAVVSTQRTRAGGTGPFAAPSRPLATELFGVTSLGPGAGIQVMSDEVARAVRRIDWDHLDGEIARPLQEVAEALGGVLGPPTTGRGAAFHR